MRLALFDFDGTITRHDSFLRFALYAKGKAGCLRAGICSLPKLIGWKLHLCSSSKAKETLFCNLFKGMAVDEFRQYCREFSEKIEDDLNPEVMQKILFHKTRGHRIALVSASIAEWIRPWAEKHGISSVLATEIETDKYGRLTGRFLTPNCTGPEKVRRIKAEFNITDDTEIWAYGNSLGDKEMLSLAGHTCLVGRRQLLERWGM